MRHFLRLCLRQISGHRQYGRKDFGDGSYGGYSEDDWNFYKGLRDGKPESDPKRLTLYSGNQGQYYNKGETPDSSGDGLTSSLRPANCF